MAGKIRGITIELGADASGLTKALEGINSEINSTSKQLKDVDRLLKLDPTNTELLRQKTQLLQEQIGNCTEKLNILKQAQQTMDENGIDKNSDQYQALQREIVATEQELNKLKGSAESSSSKLEQVSEVTGKIGDKMESIGKKMSIVSAALVALGAGAVKAFNEVDEGADIVIKKTGATGEAAEELEQSYKNVAQNIVADWEDIGSAIGEVSTRFHLTGGELEDLSEEFLKFADINEMDVTNAVSGVDQAMKTFNVDQGEAKNVMGLLSKTSQDTGISMDTLLGLLQSSGSTLKEMGLGLGESVTLMGNFESAGIDSNEMLGKMSKAAVYFNKKGLDMNSGLSDLILRLQDSSTESAATAEAYEIFGSKAGLAFITAAKEGKISISDLSGSLADYGTVVNDTYQQTLDGTDKMKLAWQNMQLGLAELGSTIGETLAPIMDKITEVIKGVVDWFTNLDDGTKNTIVTVGLLVAAIGPLLTIGGKVMQGISSITGALSKIGTVATGPIGLVITAAAALTTGILALRSAINNAYREASPFTEALDSMRGKNDELAKSIDSTKSAYENSSTAADANAAAAKGLYERLQNLIEGYDGTATKQSEIQGTIEQLNKLVPGLGLSWDSVTNSLNKTNDEIYANIEAMRAQAQVAALQDMYTESLKQQYEAQKNVSDSARTLTDVLDRYGLSVLDCMQLAAGGATAQAEFNQKVMDSGVAFYELEAATDEVAAAWQNYSDAKSNSQEVTENVTFAEQKLSEAMQAAAAATQASASEIEKACMDVFGGTVPEQLQIAINKAEAAGVEIPQSLVDGIRSGETSVEDACQKLAELTNKEEEAKKAAADTAEAYTTTFTEGVADAADDVDDAAHDVVDELDVSDEAYDYGEDAGENFDEGLGSTVDDIESTTEDIVNGMNSTVEPLGSDMNTAGDSAGSNLEGGFGDWKGTIEGTVEETYNYFLHFFCDILPGMMSTWGSLAGMNLNQGLNNYVPDIQSTVSGIVNDIDSTLAALPGMMEAEGYNGGAGLYNGLASWEGALYSLANTIAWNISQTIRNAFNSHSPSRVMMAIGDDVGEGLAIGIKDSGEAAIKTSKDVANNIIGAFGTDGIATGLNAMNSSIHTNMRNSATQANASGVAMNQLLSVLTQYLPYLAADKDIHFDDGTWAGVLAPAIEKTFATMNTREKRG